MSSSVAPFASFSLNSAVLPRSSASVSFCMSFSSLLIASTLGRMRRTARSCEVPKIFLIAQVNIGSVAFFTLGRGGDRRTGGS